MALSPIQALAGEGTPQLAEWRRINIERAQESLAQWRKQERIPAVPEHVSFQKLVAQSYRKHTR
jgi:hypothetical protein